MTDAILALNAGSSSIKFSLFDTTNGISSHSLLYQGAVDGIGGNPHFLVQDTTGQRLVDEQLKTKATTQPGHKEALGVLLDWVERQETGLTLIAVGHRVVHGGTLFLAPVLVDSQVINQLESLVPLAPLHQPHNLAVFCPITLTIEQMGVSSLPILETGPACVLCKAAKVSLLPWALPLSMVCLWAPVVVRLTLASSCIY